MSLIPDTSAWVEWFVDGEQAGAVEPVLRDPTGFTVPTLVRFETYTWLLRERGEHAADRAAAWMPQGDVRELSRGTAVFAARLAVRHGLASADAIIYAHPRELAAELLTLDHHEDADVGLTRRRPARHPGGQSTSSQNTATGRRRLFTSRRCRGRPPPQ